MFYYDIDINSYTPTAVLFSDFLFSKYTECKPCTPRTAIRLRDVFLVRDRTREHRIKRSIFFTG